MSDPLQPHGLFTPWNSPGQNIWVGSLSLLQRIHPTQGSNPGLPHCSWILYQLSQKESPRILDKVTYPFSSGSSWPRNQTGISCIAGRFFTNWDQTVPVVKNHPWIWTNKSDYLSCFKLRFCSLARIITLTTILNFSGNNSFYCKTAILWIIISMGQHNGITLPGVALIPGW